MSQEQQFDVSSLWGSLSFDGKDQYTLLEDGKLFLHLGETGKERMIAEFTAEDSVNQINELGERFAQLKEKVAEMAKAWETTEDKLQLADKITDVIHQVKSVAAIGNMDKLMDEVAVWEQAVNELHEANYGIKLQLAEEAEKIAASEDWKEATAQLKDITERWKQTGHTDKHRSDKLWARIEAAKDKFFDRKRHHFEEHEKEMLQNLDLKLDLVEQAEGLAASDEWKKATETFHRLTSEWKNIGHTLNKKNEELWQRFIAAKSVFFDRKREHFDKIQQEHEHNYQLKLALVEQAEGMRESTDWNKTAKAYGDLMTEWKKTGRVGGERGDELWQRFTAAADVFFNAKRQHTDELHSVFEKNLELKRELIARAERLKNSTHWGETTAEMNELLDEWKKIGPVAREFSNKVWNEFLAIRKHFFARKDANRDQRRQHVEMVKSIKKEQAREAVGKLLRDIEEEEQKQLDFREALGNITPGKKAEELRQHLENLLEEGVQKIKRMKEKYAALQDEYGKKAAQPRQPEEKAEQAAAEAATVSATTEEAVATTEEQQPADEEPQNPEPPAAEDAGREGAADA